MMRKIIGYPVCWGLFWVGDLVSKTIMNKIYIPGTYPAYSWLMNTSADVQDWAALDGPWISVNE